MPSSRNLRWVVLGLVLLLAGAGVIWWRPARPKPAPQSSNKEVKPVANEVKFVGEVRSLEPGKVMEAELKGGEGHAYELDLKVGEYAYAVAEQKGIDVAVRLLGPDGQQILRVDSLDGPEGPEPIHEIAEAAGTYRIEVRREDLGTEPGKYEIRIEQLRAATEIDRKRTTAEKTLAQGEELRRSGGSGRRGALVAYQKTLPLWKELGLKDREAEALFLIGWVSRDLSDADAAVGALEQALPYFQEAGKKTRTGIILNTLSTAYLQRGDSESSLDRAGRALALFKEQKDPELEASGLNSLASALYSMGQTQKALDAFQEALTLARSVKNPLEEAVALFGIGDIRTDQGKPELALDSLQQALGIHRSLNSPRDAANTRRRIANVLQRLGRMDEALANLNKALKIYTNVLQDIQGEVITLNSIGTVDLLSKKEKEAGEAYQQALTLIRQIKDPFNEAITLTNLGRYALAAGEKQQALVWHNQAVALFQTIGNGNPSVAQTSALFGSAKAMHALGDFKGAEERLEQIRKNVELLRGETDSFDLRTSYFAAKQNYYDLYIDVLMHLHEIDPGAGYADRAFDINEGRRARGLLEMLGEAKAGIRKGADPVLVGEENGLEQRMSALASSLTKARNESNVRRVSALEAQQRELLVRLDSLRSEVRRRSPKYAALMRPEPLNLEQVRKSVLDHETLLLVYSLGEERSFLWSVPQQGPVKTHVLPARRLIEDTARKAYNGFRHKSEAERRSAAHRAAELSEMLIKPVSDDLLTRRLLIIADGALQYLPFSALPDPRSPGGAVPLVLKHEIVSSPSASVLQTLRGELGDRDLAPRRVAVVADPVFSTEDPRLGGLVPAAGGTRAGDDAELSRSVQDLGLSQLERLPFTAEEAAAICSLVSEDQRFEAVGFDANRTTVMGGALQRYRVLHFATHGILNSKHPELSGLVLSRFDSQGKPQEGFLRSSEILNLDLRAELAVLSACETGLGAEIRGEGLVGLTQSFMYAGVPRIIVSLWNVSDRGTSELMVRFYRALFLHRLAPSSALRCAQLSLMKQEKWADPYYWAPFIFQGEWNLDIASSDDGIEKLSGGSQTTPRADADLPPPTMRVSVECPDLD